MPLFLPKLNPVSERFISPRIAFAQIRRLRTGYGQYGILGQVINVPISVRTMVNSLPRNVDDHYAIDVHIKRKMIHKSSFLVGLVKRSDIKKWLKFLVKTPMYIHYKITVDEEFLSQFPDEQVSQPLNNRKTVDSHHLHNLDEEYHNSRTRDPHRKQQNSEEDSPIEKLDLEDAPVAQQQTLLWSDDKYLRIAPAENNAPLSLLFDEHAEELTFPSIYLGEFRRFRDGFEATPFQMCSSELRRVDRRGCTPQHLLYMAMKIMRIKVRDSLSVAFKHVGKNCSVTREEIESAEYVNQCIEHNLAFLKSIPNSAFYWSKRKKDLFAMLRQLGKPTVFLTVSANEVGWPELLKTIMKFGNNGKNVTDEELKELRFMEKCNLVNEDAVTCALYFNKMVNVLMRVLQSKNCSPFGKYRVLHYFKRIEFQHRGSPHAHILLWLDNAPVKVLDEDREEAIKMVHQLISVSESSASGQVRVQTHKHTFTCYKNVLQSGKKICSFEAPFMPIKNTTILIPMEKNHPNFTKYNE